MIENNINKPAVKGYDFLCFVRPLMFSFPSLGTLTFLKVNLKLE